MLAILQCAADAASNAFDDEDVDGAMSMTTIKMKILLLGYQTALNAREIIDARYIMKRKQVAPGTLCNGVSHIFGKPIQYDRKLDDDVLFCFPIFSALPIIQCNARNNIAFTCVVCSACVIYKYLCGSQEYLQLLRGFLQ